VSDELERARNAGFVEASRIHGAEIERLRGLLRQIVDLYDLPASWLEGTAGAADQPSLRRCPDCDTPMWPAEFNVPCGRCATMKADQQSARKGLDELTRMAQEDGLYDDPGQQSVTCPRCSGVGTNYSSNYVGGSATCLLCAGHGKVIPRGDGSYQRMNADKT
jgi:hypothetical protein